MEVQEKFYEEGIDVANQISEFQEETENLGETVEKEVEALLEGSGQGMEFELDGVDREIFESGATSPPALERPFSAASTLILVPSQGSFKFVL